VVAAVRVVTGGQRLAYHVFHLRRRSPRCINLARPSPQFLVSGAEATRPQLSFIAWDIFSADTCPIVDFGGLRGHRTRTVWDYVYSNQVAQMQEALHWGIPVFWYLSCMRHAFGEEEESPDTESREEKLVLGPGRRSAVGGGVTSEATSQPAICQPRTNGHK
jgi:hypothetical protein